jgi:hypothetical protein
MRVPNVATFVYIGEMDFGYPHAIAVASAAAVNDFDRIRLLCDRYPSGYWWELCQHLVTVELVRPPTEIFGVPLRHPAHVADVVRMRDMMQTGGVYLDLDVLSVASVEPLRDSECVLSEQRLEDGTLCGVGCAVMLCHPGSEFVRAWYEGYDPARSLWHGFRSAGRDEHWSEMSTRYPAMLAARRTDVTVLEHEVFYPFNWEETGLRKLFEQRLDLPAATRCLHLWEANSWDHYLAGLQPSDVLAARTTFTSACRQVLQRSDIPQLLLDPDRQLAG